MVILADIEIYNIHPIVNMSHHQIFQLLIDISPPTIPRNKCIAYCYIFMFRTMDVVSRASFDLVVGGLYDEAGLPLEGRLEEFLSKVLGLDSTLIWMLLPD